MSSWPGSSKGSPSSPDDSTSCRDDVASCAGGGDVMGNVKRRALGLGLVVACNLLVGGLGASGASASSPGTLSKTAYLKWTNTCSSPEGGAAAKVKGTLSTTITPDGGQWQVVVTFTAPNP